MIFTKQFNVRCTNERVGLGVLGKPNEKKYQEFPKESTKEIYWPVIDVDSESQRTR